MNGIWQHLRLFLVPLLVMPLLWVLLAAPVAAHATLQRAEPAAGSAQPVAPTVIRLYFNETLELKYSTIKVYDASRQEYSQGAVQPIPEQPFGLMVAVRPLPEGNYLVSWRASSAVDGHITTGTFAFAVGNTPPPAAANGELPTTIAYAAPSVAEVVTKWVTLAAVAALIGLLVLWLVVWVPTLRALPNTPGVDDPNEQRIVQRLVVGAGLSLLILLLTTVVGILQQTAKVMNQAVTAVLDSATLTDFLFNTRTGAIWSTRLLLPLVGLMFFGPLFVAAVRGRPLTHEDDEEPRSLTGALLFGLAIGLAYLLSISLISHAAAAPFWAPLAVALDWLHLVSMAVWVGGPLGLLVTLPLLRAFGPDRRAVLLGLVRRFAQFAAIALGVLALTGSYSAWLHVGSLAGLLDTPYGRALLVKLALVALLVALGGFNHLWLRPRLTLVRTTDLPVEDRRTTILQRQLLRTVRGEVLLAGAVLLVVAVMIGYPPARETLQQTTPPPLSQTQTTGDLKTTLTLKTLQPGDNLFDLAIIDNNTGQPAQNIERVTLRITHTEMTMGEAQTTTTPRGDGHYLASGPYISMSGRWELLALVQRTNAPELQQRFIFPIGSTANLEAAGPQLTAPSLGQLNSLRGVGLLIIVVGLGCAVGGVQLFRRGAMTGTVLLLLVPTALITGGYLVYTADPTEAIVGRVPEPTNPVPVSSASIERGRTIFATNCVVCHGVTGRGDGPQAAVLNPRPPDMALPHTASHSDGYLFNAIRNGFPGSAMPAWGQTFSEAEQWDLVNYLRQFNPLTAVGATPLPSATPNQPALPPSPTAQSRLNTPAIPAASSTTSRAPATQPATPVSAGAGRLIYAADGTLWAIDLPGGPPRNLLPDRRQNSYAGDPALSPDGATIAYSVLVIPAATATPITTPPPLPGSDIWLINSDGGNPRQIYQHEQPGVLLEGFAWAADGQSLLLSATTPVIDAQGRYVNSLKEVQRLDLATGKRATIIGDAKNPTTAGAALAYVRIDPQTYQPSLWLADSDGRGGRELVSTAPQFLEISTPRFSPDGHQIIFAAAGGPAAATAPGDRVALSWTQRAWAWLIAPFQPPAVAAHGLPADLWLVAVATGKLTRITALNADDPRPAWAANGQQIAMLTGTGLYLLQPRGGNPLGPTDPGLTQISNRGSYSTLIWSTR